MGAGRPRALVAVSRVAPDIVTVSLVRQDRRPCRRSKISAGLPSRTRRRAAFSQLDHQLIGRPKSQRGARCPPADRSRGTRALYHFGSACGLAKSEAEEFAEQNEGPSCLDCDAPQTDPSAGLLPSTAGCSAQSAPAAAQASSHFLADDRPAELLAVPTYPVDRGLRGAPHPGGWRV